MEQKVIGFIGTGVMGKSMALHLLQGGYSVNVYNRTKTKTDELVNEGATWCNTIKELAVKSDIIITIVGYPADVEQVYLSEDGLIHHAKPGTLLVDMTTSTPSLAKKIAAAAREKEMYAFDAPVSGGDIGAREAKLAIMVGGDEEVFQSLLPVFSLMGTNIQHQGEAGAGQFTKMANQIAIASTMMGVCEAMVYAEKAGLDQVKVLKSIESGAAGSFSLSKLAPRMIEGDFEPGFYIKHFIKDMKIAIQSAEEMGLNTPGLTQAKQLYEHLAEKGEENAGTQALYKYYLNM
ncbi:NAD(P)-dependent oxidoreductase [Evansella halocellulosilytica]|uniref:NAD(P)-dependent oxidoreductase n=1 Tax=Evansella halocellulosilytica TaxID=2011013 RepID=UPI001C54470D|nr:NAD(P)-dependent oxidoreductase [Evansella halocellulosilytica]